MYTTTRWAFLDADNETTHSRQIGTLRLDVYRRKYRTKWTDLSYAHLEDLLDWDAYWQRPVIRVGDFEQAAKMRGCFLMAPRSLGVRIVRVPGAADCGPRGAC